MHYRDTTQRSKKNPIPGKSGETLKQGRPRATRTAEYTLGVQGDQLIAAKRAIRIQTLALCITSGLHVVSILGGWLEANNGLQGFMTRKLGGEWAVPLLRLVRPKHLRQLNAETGSRFRSSAG